MSPSGLNIIPVPPCDKPPHLPEPDVPGVWKWTVPGSSDAAVLECLGKSTYESLYEASRDADYAREKAALYGDADLYLLEIDAYAVPGCLVGLWMVREIVWKPEDIRLSLYRIADFLSLRGHDFTGARK